MATTTATLIRPARGADPLDRAAWHEVRTAARAHDLPDWCPPSRELAVGRFDHDLPGERNERFVAETGDRVAGVLEVSLPTADNTGTALLEVSVHPALRRRGIGRALWERGLQVARSHGRTRVIAESGESLQAPGPGSAFLTAVGLTRALHEAVSVLDLHDVDASRLDRLHDAAAARATSDGYRLELWEGVPSASALADIGALERTLSTDAPLGDLAWEPEVWGADRVAGTWQAVDRSGARTLHAAARRDGEPLAGWTVLVVCPSLPGWSLQWATVVAPEHRGHRLGMWLKTANVRALRAAAPDARWIETLNAVDNTPMLDVNVAMGFRRVGFAWEWQADLA